MLAVGGVVVAGAHVDDGVGGQIGAGRIRALRRAGLVACAHSTAHSTLAFRSFRLGDWILDNKVEGARVSPVLLTPNCLSEGSGYLCFLLRILWILEAN